MKNDLMFRNLGGGPTLTVTMDMVPSDIAITVYLHDGTTQDIDQMYMVKQYAITDVDYVEVTLPGFTAPNTAVEYDNLLQTYVTTRVAPKVYHYTVIDKTKDASIRAYYK